MVGYMTPSTNDVTIKIVIQQPHQFPRFPLYYLNQAGMEYRRNALQPFILDLDIIVLRLD